jgi:Ala-tRNA(Pro) deacylase
MTDIYGFLDNSNIKYERYDHPPVFTVEDVHRLTPNLPGAKTKNLFFRDKKGNRHFLVVVPADKRINLKALPKVLESSKISFGSPERLIENLGVTPGSVSLFAIVNDQKNRVEVIIDKSLWTSESFQFHPLVNTSTLVISRDSIKRFLTDTGHEVKILDIPGLKNIS